jgi:hypothetical protein
MAISEKLVTNCFSHDTAHKLHGVMTISQEAWMPETPKK